MADDRLRTEQALRRSNQALLAVIEACPLAVIALDSDRCVTLWNPAAEEMFGWRASTVPGCLAPDIPAWLQVAFDDSVEAVLDGNEIHGREYVGPRDDGRLVDILVHTAPLMDFEDKINGVVMVINDITERKRAEQEIVAAHTDAEEARIRMERMNAELAAAAANAHAMAEVAAQESHQKGVLLAAIPSILIGLSPDGRVTDWNTAAETALRVSQADAVGRRLEVLGLGWDWNVVERGLAAMMERHGSVRLDDVSFTRPDGDSGVLGLAVTPISGADGEPRGTLILGADITQRRSLERQLAQAQRLESIGQLAAGIAHEINTPTQYVGDNIRFLETAFTDLRGVIASCERLLPSYTASGVPPELAASIEQARVSAEAADIEYLLDEIPKAIEQALEGVGRVAQIVQAMKEFSYPGLGEKTPIDINRAIESTLTVARNEWKYVAEVKTELDRGMPLVPCLPGDINQVILNLVVNAAHAIGAKIGDEPDMRGTITVTTQSSGGWAEIRVADTGGGIPEHVGAKVFDPFFTTKAVGKGTGQGLAIAHNIVVEKHGGSIEFDSAPGVGTTFLVRIPLEAAP